MPWWTSLYVALMLISLPFGLLMIRRLEQDFLHPAGGLLSSLLSISFVVSYWQPDLIPFSGAKTWFILAFVIGWDLYSIVRIKERFPALMGGSEDQMQGDGMNAFYVGFLVILPAYIFGVLVCLRATSIVLN